MGGVGRPDSRVGRPDSRVGRRERARRKSGGKGGIGEDLIPVDLPVFAIEFAIVFADWAKDAARISGGDDVCGEVFGDNGSGADDGIVTDGDAGQDDDTGAEPAATADMDGAIELVDLFPEFRKDGV